MPDQLVEVAALMSQDQCATSNEANITSALAQVTLPRPSFIDRSPVVVRLTETQQQLFQTELAQPTPLQPRVAIQPVNRFEVLQMALAASIGDPMSIAEVRQGAILQDIIPTKANRDRADSSYGSKQPFSFHNDLSFLEDPAIPDFVTLACLRNTEGASTFVASPSELFAELDPSVLDELRQPQYHVKHVYNRGTPQERLGQRATPVLLANGEVRLGVDMAPVGMPATLALNSLRGLLTDRAVGYKLRPGDIMVLPNRITVHARDSFAMSLMPSERRWLQRINIRS